MQAERDIDKAITLHFLIFIGDLPLFIVPLVELELPASGLARQSQELEVSTEESHMVENGYIPDARIEHL